MHAYGKVIGYTYIHTSCAFYLDTNRHNSLANMSTEDWVKLEDSNIPHFTTENLGNYFITRTALDGRPANDCKNVNSHAYPLFREGQIHTKTQENSYLIKCVCLLEMKKR